MPTTASWVRVGRVSFGRGVFARQHIPEGTPLGIVAGKVVDDPAYASAYCIDLGNDTSLEPRAPFRYLNHSCAPNCDLSLVECEYEDGTTAPPEVHVAALRDIAEGEQLTIDYAWSADGAIPCLCGAAACRGWVVAAEELSKVKLPGRQTTAASTPRKPR
jgi:hypothetical protein